MPTTATLTVNGYNIMFMFGYAMWGHEQIEGGIVIDPSQLDMDDSECLAVIRHAAKEMYPEGENIARLGNWIRIPEAINSREEEDVLQEISERALRALNQKVWPLRDEKQHASLEALWMNAEVALETKTKRKKKQAWAKTRKTSKRVGYVYILRSSSGYYKIGRTKNPDDRLKTFSVKLPFEVEYEHVIATDDMVELEKAFHMLFEKKRVEGEWFDLNAEDIEILKLSDTHEYYDEYGDMT